MKSANWAIGFASAAYILQIAIAGYYFARPVAYREIQSGQVTARLYKDVGGIDLIPLFGLVSLSHADGFTYTIKNRCDEKKVGIDLVIDLPIEVLEAVDQGSCVLIIRIDNRAEVTRLSCTESSASSPSKNSLPQ